MGLFVILSCSAKKETKGNIQNFNETKKEIITDSVIYKKEIFHSFSSLDSKDLFRIYVTGKSLVKGEVHFQIIVNHMNLILDETFSAFGDLGYYMSELKSLGQQELTSQEQEEYIKKTLDDFFDEKAFDYPAAGPSNISVFKSPEKEIWKEIISDKSSIGFTYGVGYQDGRQIAYSRKLKKAVILVQCC